MDNRTVLLGTIAATFLVAAPAPTFAANFAQDPVLSNSVEGDGTRAPQRSRWAAFVPRPTGKNVRIDYSIWTEALRDVVLDLGPSTRLRAKSATASIGSRFVRGHTSPYRLEGTRFTFAYITDDYREGLTAYRKDLQDIAQTYDIPSFTKNEQLAFWLNLHNVALIEQIALNYPTERPSEIEIEVGGQDYPLDDAPFIEIMGQSVSLRDIREKIVFPNWSDARVMYGFYRGDVGSPLMPRYAYTSDNLDSILNTNAEDFVNSLRGFNKGRRVRYISKLYEEAAPFYFPRMDDDLEAHLLAYADEEVAEEIRADLPFKIDRYADTVADLSGGRRLGSSGASTGGQSISAETAQLLRELNEKRDYQRRRKAIGRSQGYVIIEDLLEPSESDGANPGPLGEIE